MFLGLNFYLSQGSGLNWISDVRHAAPSPVLPMTDITNWSQHSPTGSRQSLKIFPRAILHAPPLVFQSSYKKWNLFAILWRGYLTDSLILNEQMWETGEEVMVKKRKSLSVRELQCHSGYHPGSTDPARHTALRPCYSSASLGTMTTVFSLCSVTAVIKWCVANWWVGHKQSSPACNFRLAEAVNYLTW